VLTFDRRGILSDWESGVDRHWLLTWTTYGAWLPGDERGFVGATRQKNGVKSIRNQPGTEYDRDRPHLAGFARATRKLPAVRLTREQAVAVCRQIRSTAEVRGWKLFAVAVMANHVHLVVGVPGDPQPGTLLRDFESYCARELNKEWSRDVPLRWWTKSGSNRKLGDESALFAAIRYVKNQDWPLALWIRGE
jgi:REP element-mobilizing transposase RayT